MDSDVVEVVARFGGTILDVTHVGPTDTYRIGTAQGTNLTVPGLTCFPLVAGGKLRFPVGIATTERDGWTELRVGALSIHVTRTKLPRAPLARPRVERRTPAFLAASLVAHLAVWFVALAFAPFERLPAPRQRMRLAHVAAPQPPVEPKPMPAEKPAPAAAAQPGRSSRVPRPAPESVEAAEARTGLSAAEATRRVADQFDKIDVVGKLAELEPEDTYNEDDANARGFGGGPGRLDLGGTIPSGGFVTMNFDVKLCPKKSCTVTGPIPALYVRTHLLAHIDEIYACYSELAPGPGSIVLEFTITPDGGVRDARGSGLGETGPCAARVVSEIYFKALGNDYSPPRSTRVKWPVRFQPSAG